jgi:hypothetical protein
MERNFNASMLPNSNSVKFHGGDNVPKSPLLKDYERRKRAKKERAVQTPNLTVKDWITIGLSTLALFISGATAYFTVLQQSEDLEATVTDAPSVNVGAKEDFSVRGALELTFVNNGNKPVAIVDATLFLNQVGKDYSSECFGVNVGTVNLTTAAIVLKPSEVVIKRFETPQGDVRDFKIDEENKKVERFNMNGCVQMRIVTSQGGEIVTEYFGTWSIEPKSRGNKTVADRNFPSPIVRTPLMFLDRTGIRFWSDFYENISYKISLWLHPEYNGDFKEKN